MKLFVYGTLRRGQGNNRLLTDSAFVGRAVTKETFHMRCCGFPVLLRAGGMMRQAVGDVYNVGAETMAKIDRLESNGKMYQREEIRVLLDNRKYITAWCYIGMPVYWYDERDEEDGWVWSAEPAVDNRNRWNWVLLDDPRLTI